MSGSNSTSTSFTTADGTTVQVNAGPGQIAPAGPAPDFAQLDSDHDGSISRSEATGYSLLANDFNYADSSHNSTISKSEYAHWKSQP